MSNFNFFVSLVITRNNFDLIHSVIAFMQAKLNDIINGFELTRFLTDLMSDIIVNIEKYRRQY